MGPLSHSSGHLIVGVAALAATLLISSFTQNRLVRRKLRLSVFLLGAYIVVNLALAVRADALPIADAQLRSFEQLALAAAIINLLVVGIINPLRHDRVPDAFPSILQDAIVIGLFALVATFVFDDKLLTTSAVGAVVVGFALQDTLGNAFAGLAIQSEKPFRIGDWIKVGEFEGRIAEVTWRATKMRTKTGNFVIVPNSTIAKDAITNFSEPAVPTRLAVDVGASYLSTPADVKAAILEAVAQVPSVLTAPAPDVLLLSFDGSAITYRARFWVDNYEFDDEAKDAVRTAIFYSLGRHGIEIPWPIEVGYQREWPEPPPDVRRQERELVLAGVDLFARLTADQRREIASATTMRMFGDGEAIVRQEQPGQSMFVVCSGRVAIVLEPDRREVATIETGGYFGEMSLLTGDPRTATVVARGDTIVLELDADLFRKLGSADPQAVEQIGVAAIARRAELNQAREAGRTAAVTEVPATIMSRMKKFLGLA